MVSEKEMDFVVFCIENLAEHLNMDSKETYRLLSKNRLIDEYIVKNYNVLHTQSKEWILEDLVEALHKRGCEEYVGK